jgi:hypothetical protein
LLLRPHRQRPCCHTDDDKADDAPSSYGGCHEDPPSREIGAYHTMELETPFE